MNPSLKLSLLVLSLYSLSSGSEATAQSQLAFVPPQGFPPGASYTSLATGDFDGDGDTDALMKELFGSVALWLNDGDGGFALAPFAAFPPLQIQTDDVVVGDADGDGDVDALVLEVNREARMFLNDGTGRFAEDNSGLPASRFGMFWTGAFVDVDADGDDDIVLAAKALTQHTLLINDGSGVFTDETATRMPAIQTNARVLAVGDVDGDGSADLYFGAFDLDVLFINDGTGRFSDESIPRTPYTTSTTGGALLADVTGDGALDVLLGNRDTSGGWVTLWVNDGTGHFVDESWRLPLLLTDISVMDAGDIDEDGDVDLIVGNYNAQTHVLINDGTNNFTTAPERIPAHRTETYGIAVLDLDTDGDLDVLEVNRNAQYTTHSSVVFSNLHRHLDTPRPAVRGAAFDLVFYAQPGYGTAPHMAVPLIATGGARIVLPPLGTLGLDPAQLVALPAVSIPATGTETIRFRIPDQPALIGVDVFSQSVLVEGTTVRLTNRAVDSIQ